MLCTHKDTTLWEKLKKEWRQTPDEATQKIQAVRHQLERYNHQLEGACFDMPGSEMPRSLDTIDRKFTIQMIEELNPLVAHLFEAIDEYAEKHGTHEHLDFNAELFSFKENVAETGFAIGVLAGAIFAGASKETVDKFARGLDFAFKCRSDWVKRV